MSRRRIAPSTKPAGHATIPPPRRRVLTWTLMSHLEASNLGYRRKSTRQSQLSLAPCPTQSSEISSGMRPTDPEGTVEFNFPWGVRGVSLDPRKIPGREREYLRYFLNPEHHKFRKRELLRLIQAKKRPPPGTRWPKHSRRQKRRSRQADLPGIPSTT